VARLVELPDKGRLIVASDLQGNLADFDHLESIFEEAAVQPNGACLVLTGDLIHGPEIPERNWPDYLGSYFRADSATLLDRAEALANRHPGRVFYLLGNHEHAHIGGPIVSKFFADEALRLERCMGPERSAEIRHWLHNWPLVAVARHAGLVMLHAAPNAVLRDASDLEKVPLIPGVGREGMVEGVLAEILWARTASTIRARAFMAAIDERLRVAIYGHDVARSGYAIDREPLLCISSSFGCFDGDKLYLDWDLARKATSASQVVQEGLRPMYPDEKPVYRKPFSDERGPTSAPPSSA